MESCGDVLRFGVLALLPPSALRSTGTQHQPIKRRTTDGDLRKAQAGGPWFVKQFMLVIALLDSLTDTLTN